MHTPTQVDISAPSPLREAVLDLEHRPPDGKVGGWEPGEKVVLMTASSEQWLLAEGGAFRDVAAGEHSNISASKCDGRVLEGRHQSGEPAIPRATSNVCEDDHVRVVRAPSNIAGGVRSTLHRSTNSRPLRTGTTTVTDVDESGARSVNVSSRPRHSEVVAVPADGVGQCAASVLMWRPAENSFGFL